MMEFKTFEKEEIDLFIAKLDWTKVDNLLPVIIQNKASSQVLMLGYMDQAALTQTMMTGQVTFFSRTKQKLWTKGETSGHFLWLQEISMDCDADALLILVHPIGNTCHTGQISCFDPKIINELTLQPDLVWLYQLEQLIANRKNADPASSYTASLYEKGTKRIAQKVGEEGVEVALAAAVHDKKELTCESADLLYHLMVLLQDQALSLNNVIEKLKERHQGHH